jgi:hypothetical protein
MCDCKTISLSRRCSPHSEFAGGVELVSIRLLCGFVKHVSIWNSRFGKCCRYSATAVLPFSLQNMYTECISIFLTCKCETHFAFLHNDKSNASVECNNQTENERVAVALACYCTLALKWIAVMNRTIVYSTFLFFVCLFHMTSRIHPRYLSIM